MKAVILCSAYRGDTENNTRIAKMLCHLILKKFKVFAFAPHLYFTQFLDDENQEDRELGIGIFKEYAKRFDELWVYTYEGPEEALKQGITEGMQKEIDMAKKMGLPVKYMQAANGVQPKELIGKF